jgi:hypothetical protein
MRLFDRRRFNVSDRDPSLPALLRQLRTSAQNLDDDAHRNRFRLRLRATVAMARRQQANATAGHLERLDVSMSDAALADRRNVQAIEQHLDAALAALPQR